MGLYLCLSFEKNKKKTARKLTCFKKKKNIFFFAALHREFIIDCLSVERNHVLVRIAVLGGPSERKLPARALQEVSCSQKAFCKTDL